MLKMAHKYDKINADKLVWQPHMLEAGEIRTRVPKYGFFKVSREAILANIPNGKYLNRIDYYFTKKSIVEAMKLNGTTTTNNTKTKKDASTNK